MIQSDFPDMTFCQRHVCAASKRCVLVYSLLKEKLPCSQRIYCAWQHLEICFSSRYVIKSSTWETRFVVVSCAVKGTEKWGMVKEEAVGWTIEFQVFYGLHCTSPNFFFFKLGLPPGHPFLQKFTTCALLAVFSRMVSKTLTGIHPVTLNRVCKSK